MNNYQWLLQMDGADRKAWFDAEHVETANAALDGDTDALERKSADLIHEYYKPMVSELQAKVDELKAERELYREALSQLLDTVTDGMGKVSALLDNYDEGMA